MPIVYPIIKSNLSEFQPFWTIPFYEKKRISWRKFKNRLECKKYLNRKNTTKIELNIKLSTKPF